jgi:hypothetical protein
VESDLRDDYQVSWAAYRKEAAAWSAAHKSWIAACEQSLLTWPRCGQCEVFDLDAPTTHQEVGKLFAHLCPRCTAGARATADDAYPDLLPIVSTGKDGVCESAFWIRQRADALLNDAWRQVIKEWPRCDDCPAMASPPKPKEAEKPLEDRVLEFLAVHGTVNGTDLTGGVRGLTRNNVKPVTSSLEEAGLITIEQRGTAKFYALAA